MAIWHTNVEVENGAVVVYSGNREKTYEGKFWVAKINSIGGQYGYDRTFIAGRTSCTITEPGVYQVFRDCQWSKGNAEKYFIRVHIVDGELTYHVTAEKNVEKWLNEFSAQVEEAAQSVEVTEVAIVEVPAPTQPKQVVAIVIHRNLVKADQKLIRKIQRKIRAALGTANYKFRTFANSAANSFDFNTPFIEFHTNSVGMTETADIWDMSGVFANPLSGVGTIKVQF